MIGIDEVGRGAWAGPLLVVAARANARLPKGLADSKILSKKKREHMFDLLKETCNLGEGWVESFEVDKLGLTGAMELAVERALAALKARCDDEIIMDGHINYCPDEFTNVACIIKADAKHPIVSAASIYAKVLRDRKMTKLAVKYPQYGFENHVGYGTREHIEGLKTNGVSVIHRLSYKPIKAFRQ